MKIILSITTTLLILAGCLPAQTIQTGKKAGLTGPVRTVRYVNPYQIQEVDYDRQGNELARTLYKPDGTVSHESSHTYNADGLMTGWKEYYGKDVVNPEGLHKHAVFTYLGKKLVQVIVYSEDSIDHKSTYIYDDRGRKTREIKSGPDAVATTRTFKYDSNDNIVEEAISGMPYRTRIERSYDAQRHLIRESHFENDALKPIYIRVYENEKLVKAEAYSAAGEVTETTLNTYNSAGELSRSTFSRPSLTSKTVIGYDENGQLKRRETLTISTMPNISYSNDPSPGRVVTNYNEKGLAVETLNYSRTGALVRRQTTSYNEQGKPQELIVYKNDAEIENRNFYEYDEHGNKVKTIVETITPQGEIKRSLLEQITITYY